MVGGCGDIEAAGNEASNGASSSSARGGRIGGCMVLWKLLCTITCKSSGRFLFVESSEKRKGSRRTEDILWTHYWCNVERTGRSHDMPLAVR